MILVQITKFFISENLRYFQLFYEFYLFDITPKEKINNRVWQRKSSDAQLDPDSLLKTTDECFVNNSVNKVISPAVCWSLTLNASQLLKRHKNICKEFFLICPYAIQVKTRHNTLNYPLHDIDQCLISSQSHTGENFTHK